MQKLDKEIPLLVFLLLKERAHYSHYIYILCVILDNKKFKMEAYDLIEKAIAGSIW